MLFYVKSNERLSGKVTFEIRPKGSKGISCGEYRENGPTERREGVPKPQPASEAGSPRW